VSFFFLFFYIYETIMTTYRIRRYLWW